MVGRIEILPSRPRAAGRLISGRREGYPSPLVPSGPSVAPTRVRNMSEWPGATWAGSPGKSGCPDISGRKLPTLHLTYLARIR